MTKVNENERDLSSSGRNVGEVTILNEQGENITSPHRVILDLSREALFELGNELVALSTKFKDGKHFHLMPSTKEFVSETLGLFLTGTSSD